MRVRLAACWAKRRSFRDLGARATEEHFAGIRASRVEKHRDNALDLDILRDVKRINAHSAAAAYAVLERRGELLPSRLRRGTKN
jgi:phosphate:Na+ symporter